MRKADIKIALLSQVLSNKLQTFVARFDMSRSNLRPEGTTTGMRSIRPI